jgi:hypothetical protein
MTTYSVTHSQRIDGYASVQLLQDAPGLAIGRAFNLASFTHIAALNGNHTIYSLVDFELVGVDDQGDLVFDTDISRPGQVIFKAAGDDVARDAETGTFAYNPVATWIVVADVTEFLGIAAATANDTAFMGSCVNAANQFAFRRRRESGYFDALTSVPSADVKLGTVLYAGGLYRERGSVDSFQSYDSMSMPQPTLSLGRVLQLLGCGRPQVG